MCKQGKAESACPRAERDEDSGETKHEAEAQAERAKAITLAGSGLTGHVGHVARDEGQDAGRQEGYSAGSESRQETYA